MGARKADPCCESWRKAFQYGTDSEGYGPLLFDDDGKIEAGYDLPSLVFCPWCGSPAKPIAQQKGKL
jgi:hypothetical protein